MNIKYTEMIGKRIKFIRHIDPDPQPLTPGEEGTVIAANKYQVRVEWDSGRGLHLAQKGDVYIILN